MLIACIGLNHRNAPVEVRERFAVATTDVPHRLKALAEIPNVHGAVIVSTCNRIEYYVAAESPAALDTVERVAFARESGESGESRDSNKPTHSTPPTLPILSTPPPSPYLHHGTDCARHLFRVACGLDSMIPGETEILGQIKAAYAAAVESDVTEKHLHRLFQLAFRVAKRIRTDTRVTRGPTSVGAAACELAEKIFGDLGGCRVVLLGAGETSEMTARSLVARGVHTVIVSNRNYDRAETLAREIGGRAIRWGDVLDQWHEHPADIIVCSTSAPHYILTPEKVAPMLKARHPLFVIDLAVPRNADPALASLAGLHLYDIDSLERIVHRSLEDRRAELIQCDGMIETHVSSFAAWHSGVQTSRLCASNAPSERGRSRELSDASDPKLINSNPSNPTTSFSLSGAKLRIGTRGSPLALAQCAIVEKMLAAVHPSLAFERVVIRTTGDERLDLDLSKVGSLDKGLFTREIEHALLDGTIDCAVHSLKDIPVELPEGLALGAIPPRADPCDALVSKYEGGLAGLPHGARVGTSSPRRIAALAALRPDVMPVPIRGNIGTRLLKLEESDLDALLVAKAALDRLGSTNPIFPLGQSPKINSERQRPSKNDKSSKPCKGEIQTFDFAPSGLVCLKERLRRALPCAIDSRLSAFFVTIEDAILPAPGQGALAIECRTADTATLDLLTAIHDDDTARCVTAEREALREQGGGCSSPFGALARIENGRVVLTTSTNTKEG